MRIGILGATGPAGGALAVRLASVGYEVVVGSRSTERAERTRDELVARWPGRALTLEAADNAGAAGAELVVVATPWNGAAATAAGLAEHLDGKVVISMANAVARSGQEFQALIPARGSIAAEVQAAAPGARVTAAFHHVPAKELGAIEAPVDCDVLVCGDRPDAVATTSEVVAKIPGLRPVDAGRLSAAGPVESLTAVLIGMNLRYRARLSIRLTGLPE